MRKQMSTKKEIGMLIIGFCNNMTSPNAALLPVAYYQIYEGKVDLTMIVGDEQDLGLAKDILESACTTCTTLEEVKEMFSSPHASLQLMEAR
jgi:hypothetical protein